MRKVFDEESNERIFFNVGILYQTFQEWNETKNNKHFKHWKK